MKNTSNTITETILQQNSTHKAVKVEDKIQIIIKGFEIEDLKYDDEYLYSIPADQEEDLFAIFERLDEDNRINVAELNESTCYSF